MPADVESVVILDIDDTATPVITLTFADGTTETINTVVTGDNGLLTLPINRDNVIQFKVRFASSGTCSCVVMAGEPRFIVSPPHSHVISLLRTLLSQQVLYQV